MAVLDTSIPVLRFFEVLTRIPHGSGNEKEISDYLMQFAQERGCRAVQDELYNLLIYVPATVGYEDHEPVILQAHMDMVCEKNQDVTHDFLKDPLKLIVEDGWLKAQGTTLGADDGCGVAYMMAILDDPDAKHPPLELLLTVSEETGMQGAAGFDYSLLTGKRMIGLDAAGENTTVASSAGGLRVDVSREVELSSAMGAAVSFRIRGLLGGHSGVFINKERGNSNKLAARILYRITQAGIPYGLIAMNGGSKDNAIPRECDVTLSCKPEQASDVLEVIHTVTKEIQQELAASDKDFFTEAETVDCPQSMISEDCTDKLVKMLYLMPNGVAAMNMEMKDLVETSDNVGVIDIDETGAEIKISLRSADDSRLDELRDRILLLADLFGGQCSQSGRYPGMEYQSVSAFRDLYAQLMQEIWHKELRVFAGHAGGEGGYFSRNIPAFEMVCLGPMIEDVHCPDEKMELSSFLRVYDFLKEVLARV